MQVCILLKMKRAMSLAEKLWRKPSKSREI